MLVSDVTVSVNTLTASMGDNSCLAFSDTFSSADDNNEFIRRDTFSFSIKDNVKTSVEVISQVIFD